MDTGYSRGGIPITEGGVLGRDFDAADTNSASDWRAHGGENAFGPTFGRRNNAAAAGGINDLIGWAQTEVNNVIGIFSLYNFGYVDVLDGTTRSPGTKKPARRRVQRLLDAHVPPR